MPASSLVYLVGARGRHVIRGLRFIRLQVGDLDRSLAFYRRGLRFAAGAQDAPRVPAPSPTRGPANRRPDLLDGAPRRATLAAGSLRLLLVEVVEPAENDSTGRGVELAIEVAGVDAYHDVLVARGLDPNPPVDDEGERAFTVRDPDGYRWRVYQSMD